MGTYLNSEEEGPTFEERALGLTKCRQWDVALASRDFIHDEVNHVAFGHIYAMLSLAHELKYQGALQNSQTLDMIVDGQFRYFVGKDGYGEIIKLQPERIQIKASEKLRKIVKEHPYVKTSSRFRGSLLIPIGCLGWGMLLTDRDDIMTFDQIGRELPIVDYVFIKRGFLEPLRRVLRSRNQFTPTHSPQGKFNLRLQKSNLTLGMVDHLSKDWAKAITERLDDIHLKCYNSPNRYSEIVVEETGERYLRNYSIKAIVDGRVITVATAKLIDRIFYLEI